jgi:predicted MFS family arabinose efflux permease
VVVGGLLALFAWQTVFRLTLVPAVAFAVIFLVLMQGFATGHPRGHTTMGHYFSSLARAARHRPLLLSIIAGSARSGGQIVLITFVTLYARDTLGLGSGVAGALASLLLGLSIVSQPVLAYISDRIGRKWTAFPAAVALTVLAPLLAATTGPVSLFVVVTAIGLIMFSTSLVLNAYGLDIAPPELHSSITAAQFLCGLAVGTVAPLVAGQLAEAFGIHWAFFVAGGLFGVTTITVLMLPNVKGSKPTSRFGFS